MSANLASKNKQTREIIDSLKDINFLCITTAKCAFIVFTN